METNIQTNTKNFIVDHSLPDEDELVKVAVYGSLKEGFYNHSVLDGATKIKDEIINGFQMYDMGWYPAVLPSRTSKKLRVEVYRVDRNILKKLDALEGVPNLYKRILLKKQNIYMYIFSKKELEKVRIIKDNVWKENL